MTALGVGNGSSERPLTAVAALQLATPSGISRGLGLLGIEWLPQPYDKTSQPRVGDDSTPGMYVWVIPGVDADPVCCPSLYIGIGERADGGWRARVRSEEAQTGDEWIHGHGMAVTRTNAQAVGARVRLVRAKLPDWVEHQIGPKRVEAVQQLWMSLDDATVLAAAERVAIRLAMHLGYTVTPVNAQFATAWKNNSPHDWAAMSAAWQLRGSPS